MKAWKGTRAAVTTAFAVAALLGGTSAAWSQTTAASGHLYAGATYGQSHWRPGCKNSGACDDTDRTLGVFGGYQINRTFAAEVGFRNLGEAGGDATVKAHAWEAVGKAAWPIAGALSVYGKLGIFRTKAQGGGSLGPTTETNYGPTYGIGAQMELSPNVALRAEWQAYSGVGGSTLPKSDINVLAVGALWRFQ
jgi:opacity protein-like surface antigen